jgi:hypothetical protein
VQGADAALDLARGVGAVRLTELAVLFSFIVLLALFTQPVMTVYRVGAVRRALLGPSVRILVARFAAMEGFHEGLTSLVALLTFSVDLLALDVSVVRHWSLRGFVAGEIGKARARNGEHNGAD